MKIEIVAFYFLGLFNFRSTRPAASRPAMAGYRPAGGPAKRGIDPCLRALGKSRAAGGSLSGSVSASLRVAARVSSTDSASIREERAAVSDSRERERIRGQAE